MWEAIALALKPIFDLFNKIFDSFKKTATERSDKERRKFRDEFDEFRRRRVKDKKK